MVRPGEQWSDRIPLRWNLTPADSEHIRPWTRLVEKGKQQTERQEERDRVPHKGRTPTSALCFIVQSKLFFLHFPPARVEETTPNCTSWRYIKVLNLLSCCGACRVRGAALCLFASINLLIREEKAEVGKLNYACFLPHPPSNFQAERIDTRTFVKRWYLTLLYSTYSIQHGFCLATWQYCQIILLWVLNFNQNAM